MTLVEAIQEIFLRKRAPVHIRDLYAELPDSLEHSIRARVYENLGRLFKRIGPGLYIAEGNGASCVVVEGDSWEEIRRLPSDLADCLITDPPYNWLDPVTVVGQKGDEHRVFDFTEA